MRVGLTTAAAEKIAAGYFAHDFRDPCPVRLSLLALDECEFEAVVPLAGAT